MGGGARHQRDVTVCACTSSVTEWVGGHENRDFSVTYFLDAPLGAVHEFRHA